MNIEQLQTASKTLREALQKELDTRHEVNLELGVTVALSDYVKWQKRLEEIRVELRGLDVIDTVLNDMAQRAERELQALQALQAERKQKAGELLKRLDGMPHGPEYSMLCAEIALLTQ